MWWGIETVFTVVEAIIKIYFLTKFFGFKENVTYKFAVFSAMTLFEVFVVTTLNQFYIFEGLLGFAIYICVSSIYCILFLKGNILQKFLVCCCVEIFLFLLSMLGIMFFGTVLNIDIISVITSKDYMRISYLIIINFTKLFATIFVLKFRKNSHIHLNAKQLSLLIVTFVVSVAVMFSCFELFLQLPATSKNAILSTIISLGIVIITVFEFCFMFYENKRNKQLMEYKLQKIQLEEQKKRICTIDDEYKNISILRHDFKNYLSCTVDMINNHQYEEANEYLKTLVNDKINNTARYVNLGNNPITSVLNLKINECIEKHITVDYVINADISGVSEMDLCILLANIFDNAIEACYKQKNSDIHFEMNNRKNYLCIFLKNSVSKSVLGENPKLFTTKADKTIHGLGTQSVKNIIENNNGIVDYSEENEYFCCRIMLPVKK